MSDNNIEKRIEALDNKVDLLLNYVNEQRLRSEGLDDLIADASIIGKDLYDSAVAELDKQSVELDPSTLSLLASKFLKNIPNFAAALEMFESITDLVKDAGPIVNEVIIDITRKLHELDQKGYMEFIKACITIVDNTVTYFSKDDVKLLADNIVTILETIKSMTQPEMMAAINNAVQVFASVEQENIPSYSIFKVIREMNKPEMKRALGFIMMFLKNLSMKNYN